VRRSKYLGLKNENWTCIHVGITSVTGAKYKTRGHRHYYYIFTRPTSDGKTIKQVRLNAREATKVYRGLITVEEIEKARRLSKTKQKKFTTMTNYHFIDRD